MLRDPTDVSSGNDSHNRLEHVLDDHRTKHRQYGHSDTAGDHRCDDNTTNNHTKSVGEYHPTLRFLAFTLVRCPH